MNKVIIVVVLIALVAVGVSCSLLASRSALEAPAIVAARATAETAKAQQEQARAASDWAKAQEDETHARAVVASEADIRGGIVMLAWGVPAVLLAALILATLAFGQWAFTQAAVIRPHNGELPLVWRAGELLDPARSIGGVVGAGEYSETALLQVAQNSAAAGVMVAAVRADAKSGTALAEKIKGAASGLAGLMPVPTFGATAAAAPAGSMSTEIPGAPGEGLRLVYVRGGKSEAQKDLDDLREFIEQGAQVRGFARRGWLGFKFGSGRECTRTIYDDLCYKLLKAKVMEDTTKGRVLACSPAEALAAFGLGG